MALFGTKSRNIALLDVRSSSVGAGFAVVHSNRAPTLAYQTRLPLEVRSGEELNAALARTVPTVLEKLVGEGAAALRAASGSGKIDKVFVTSTAPWQQSNVFTHAIEPEHPFVFSRQHLAEAAADAPELSSDRTRVSEMAIATLLNGYEVHNPFGKRVRRAELIMMSSSIENGLMEMVTGAVRGALHQHHIEFDAFIPNAYAVFRDLYPHQRDFLMLDIGTDATNVLLAKHGLLLSSSCIAHGMGEITRAAQAAGASTSPLVERAELEWLSEMEEALGAIAKEEPLPRTVFLMAEEPVRDFLKQLLDAPQLRPLWLSEESLAIMPVKPEQFAPYLTQSDGIAPDPWLAVLALAAQKRFV